MGSAESTGELRRDSPAILIKRLRERADWMNAYEAGTEDDEALLREAADALEQQWVSVEERLPSPGERVVFFDALTKAVYIGRFSVERACPNSEWGWHPSWTDWRPLPEPPQGADGGE